MTTLNNVPFTFNDATIRGASVLWFRNRKQALIIYGPIGDWDVSGVTDMSFLFASQGTFNEDIRQWDVQNVTNMAGMFKNCHMFNQLGTQASCAIYRRCSIMLLRSTSNSTVGTHRM